MTPAERRAELLDVTRATIVQVMPDILASADRGNVVTVTLAFRRKQSGRLSGTIAGLQEETQDGS